MAEKREKKPQRIEYLITSALSIHQISIISLALYFQWERWVSVAIAILSVLNWLLLLGKYQTVKVRALITGISINFSLLMFSYYYQNYLLILVPLCATMALLALYDESIAIVPSAVAFFIITAFDIYGVIIGLVECKSISTEVIVPAVNVVTMIGVVNFWILNRRKKKSQMQSVIDRMQKAQDTKDDFLANVSHEIRTPINTISGLSEVLMEERDPSKMREDLLRIQMAGKSLMFVVSDILDFSELEKGYITIEEEQYSTINTINDIINMAVAQKGNNANIELIVNYPPDIPRLLIGDEKKLRRAVMNVVGNAFKFTEEGCVVLDFSFREEDYGINLMINVRDTGIGMRPEELDKLFSTYNQADTSKSRTEGGLGLGLAISRAIIQQMGGTISVFSDYERGTEIRFVIPQKVFDSRPLAQVVNPDQHCVGILFSLEKYNRPETRDEYIRALGRLQTCLSLRSFFCKNLAELKRRQAENNFTHIFVGLSEYLEDTEYFDALSMREQVTILIDREVSSSIQNPRIFTINKPLRLLPVVQILNGEFDDGRTNDLSVDFKFEAPEAKILVVDDNEMNIRVAEKLLSKFGVSCSHAISGAEALEILDDQFFDLIFMDHMMPEMDGVEALHRIRAKSGRYFREVPVVALTANAVAGAREYLLEEGFNAYMEKPIELAVLERLLAQTLPTEKIVPVKGDSPKSTSEEPEAKIRETSKEVSQEVSQKESVEEIHDTSDLPYTYESLDQEQGELYCGSKESWEEILKVYAEKKQDNYLPLQKLFEEQDWKNYTIMIHGVKSSMKSIGGNVLSEKARLLEMAGREENIDYILEHHEETYKMYQSLILDLMKHFGVEESDSVDVSELADFSEEEMNECIAALEDAMYNLDGEEMKKTLAIARGKRYQGKAIDPIIETVEHKISMADYMSAFDTFVKLKS